MFASVTNITAAELGDARELLHSAYLLRTA